MAFSRQIGVILNLLYDRGWFSFALTFLALLMGFGGLKIEKLNQLEMMLPPSGDRWWWRLKGWIVPELIIWTLLVRVKRSLFVSEWGCESIRERSTTDIDIYCRVQVFALVVDKYTKCSVFLSACWGLTNYYFLYVEYPVSMFYHLIKHHPQRRPRLLCITNYPLPPTQLPPYTHLFFAFFYVVKE